MNFLDTVHRVIDLARRTREYYDAELPKFHPDYPLVHESESEPPPPPTEAELREFLGTLPDDTLHRLIALGRVAWGKMIGNDFQALVDHQKRTYADRSQAIDHLMNKGGLEGELEDGLEDAATRGAVLERGATEHVSTRN